jgi:hyperosmotically inducible protein
MKRTLAVLITLAAIGCKQTESTEAENPPMQPAPENLAADKPAAANMADKRAAADPQADAPKPTAADKTAEAVVPADNTGKNERDRESAALTPMDQGANEGDRTITQQIRSNVVKADEMSMNGKNVKIITVDGVVTLRGPVESAREKKDIANIVKHVDGVKRIDNQLEVATK